MTSREITDIEIVELPEFSGNMIKYIVVYISGRVVIRGGNSEEEHEKIEKALESSLSQDGFQKGSLEIRVLGGGRIFKCDRKKFLLILAGSGKYYAADIEQAGPMLIPYFREEMPEYEIRVGRQLPKNLY